MGVRLAQKSGPVAQLGARLNGIQEVTGSIPVRSTNSKRMILKGKDRLPRLSIEPALIELNASALPWASRPAIASVTTPRRDSTSLRTAFTRSGRSRVDRFVRRLAVLPVREGRQGIVVVENRKLRARHALGRRHRGLSGGMRRSVPGRAAQRWTAAVHAADRRVHRRVGGAAAEPAFFGTFNNEVMALDLQSKKLLCAEGFGVCARSM
jgi:hypothetical protein